MVKNRLVLIRHSKTVIDPDKPNVGWILSDEGIKLAEELAQDRVFSDVDVVYSSDQIKARETAKPIVNKWGLDLQIDSDLTEVSSFTRGFFAQDYHQKVIDFYQSNDISYFNGETLRQAENRISKAIRDIIVKNSGKNIAVVSHSNALTIFTKKYFPNLSYTELHDQMPMPSYCIIDYNQGLLIKPFND